MTLVFNNRRRSRSRFTPTRLVIGALFALFAFITYQCSTEFNPVTGEKQQIAMTASEEIAIGLQAAPEMAQQHGGLSPDKRAQALVDEVGHRIVDNTAAAETPWQFDFHLLADDDLVNAFALPGGQIFITEALYDRFETEGELAGVLGHEVGHVVARHASERLAKQKLTNGLTGGVLIASGGGASEAQIAQMVGQLINLRYGREDELQSDMLGVRFMAEAGYDPRALLRVMEILESSSGGSQTPGWYRTHPNYSNRVARIELAISEVFPDGIPGDLRR
ncbi:MAG: M48 family metalloprotease [Gammaproteobacteria bacterium]|nr:M48 family metalloprotease [Gammaproteobacteria bacterium]NND59190.1 M48 family metalloprotease [Gammaproteobacteria bacterium]